MRVNDVELNYSLRMGQMGQYYIGVPSFVRSLWDKGQDSIYVCPICPILFGVGGMSEPKKEKPAIPAGTEQDDSRKLGPEEPNFSKKRNWALGY